MITVNSKKKEAQNKSNNFQTRVSRPLSNSKLYSVNSFLIWSNYHEPPRICISQEFREHFADRLTMGLLITAVSFERNLNCSQISRWPSWWLLSGSFSLSCFVPLLLATSISRYVANKKRAGATRRYHSRGSSRVIRKEWDDSTQLSCTYTRPNGSG